MSAEGPSTPGMQEEEPDVPPAAPSPGGGAEPRAGLPRSAGVLLTVCLAERDRRTAILAALDTKLGILLALAGVLVVVPLGWPVVPWRLLAEAPALLAAVVCVRGTFTRGIEALDLRRARDLYLLEEPVSTSLVLLDTLITYDEGLETAHAATVKATNRAAWLLLVALAVNVVLGVLQPWSWAVR